MHLRGEHAWLSCCSASLPTYPFAPASTLPVSQWVTELFAAVPGGRGPRPQYGGAGPPFEGGRLYLLPAVRDEHRLTAAFQLPCLNGKYRCGRAPGAGGRGGAGGVGAARGGSLNATAPRLPCRLAPTTTNPAIAHSRRKKADEYLAHFVGHEGAGSLLSALKARGWATELSAGVSDQSSVMWLFEVSFTLTEAGLAARPGERRQQECGGVGQGRAAASAHLSVLACLPRPPTPAWPRTRAGCGLAAAGLLFEYLAMLRAAGPQRWAYDELAAIAQMRFRFQVGGWCVGRCVPVGATCLTGVGAALPYAFPHPSRLPFPPTPPPPPSPPRPTPPIPSPTPPTHTYTGGGGRSRLCRRPGL